MKTRIKAKIKIKKNIKKYGADAPYFFIIILSVTTVPIIDIRIVLIR